MKRISTLAALLICTVVSATSQCPTDATCDPDEFIVLIAAFVTGMRNICARIDPAQEEQYSAELEKQLNTNLNAEDSEMLRKAMNSPLFSVKLKEAELEMEKMENAELVHECASFLRSR